MNRVDSFICTLDILNGGSREKCRRHKEETGFPLSMLLQITCKMLKRQGLIENEQRLSYFYHSDDFHLYLMII